MSGDRILLVEDDKEIREGVEIFLKSQGYEVLQAADGVEGLKVLEEREIDLAIVDVMMPRMGSIIMTVKLREKYDFPVIFLSVKSEEVDKVLGLNTGADDYIIKSLTPMELTARVNPQLRRYRRFLDRLNSKQVENPKAHRLGGLEVNEEMVEVVVDDKTVKVTPTEFGILPSLIQNPGCVFPVEGIYERVWNERAVNTDMVMVHICNLRGKIEVNPGEPECVKVVWEVGCKIEE